MDHPVSTVWLWFSRLLLALLVFVIVLAAIWAYGRLTSPTAAQQAAIAVMQAAPVGDGENGFPMLSALAKAPGPFPTGVNCGEATQPTCIDAIEAPPEANAAVLEPFRPQIEAAARVLRTGAGVDDLPPYTTLTLMTQLDSLRALDFAAGNTAGALSATCEDARGAVHWATNPNTLLDGMVGIAMFRQSADLIADMRRRAPMDALPESCMALAEPPDPAREGTLCATMRGEYRWFAAQRLPALTHEISHEVWPRWMAPLLHDPDWVLARIAERYAPTCGPAAEAAAREDRATGFATLEPRWVDRVAFPVSMVLDRIAEPAYLPYPERQLDFVGQRRLLAALLQMDAMTPALTNPQRFAALSPQLRDGPRPLALAADGSQISVPMRAEHNRQEGPEARLPLPDRAPASAVATEPATTDG